MSDVLSAPPALFTGKRRALRRYLLASDTACNDDSRARNNTNNSSPTNPSPEPSSTNSLLDWGIRLTPLAESQLSKGSRKKSPTLQFKEYFRKLSIKNSKHYDYLISTDTKLQRLENQVSPNQIEAIKKKMFNQHVNDEFIPYVNQVNKVPMYTETEGKVFSRFWTTFLSTVSNENGITMEDMISDIFSILSLEKPKKSTIFLLG
eukprot:TCONS_00031530-protein